MFVRSILLLETHFFQSKKSNIIINITMYRQRFTPPRLANYGPTGQNLPFLPMGPNWAPPGSAMMPIYLHQVHATPGPELRMTAGNIMIQPTNRHVYYIPPAIGCTPTKETKSSSSLLSSSTQVSNITPCSSSFAPSTRGMRTPQHHEQSCLPSTRTQADEFEDSFFDNVDIDEELRREGQRVRLVVVYFCVQV